jgi:DNA-binding response OmpR family regulator
MDDDILIIDDEDDIIHFMRRVLMRAGYRVRTASDGATALTVIANRAPAIVLLDWGLPDISGEMVLAHLHTAHPTVPVIVITGDPRPVQALGFSVVQHILLKPFELTELLTIVAPYVVAHRSV